MLPASRLIVVALGSTRVRVLQAITKHVTRVEDRRVALGSTRVRVLQDASDPGSQRASARCVGLDPSEGTARPTFGLKAGKYRSVALGSTRVRVLQVEEHVEAVLFCATLRWARPE